jgi:AraC-like DNA-binding protein
MPPTVGGARAWDLDESDIMLTMPSSLYTEVAPPAALAGRAACVWLRAPGPARPHRVLPDGCVDLIWHDGQVQLVGPMTHALTSVGVDDASAGVRLRPGAARLLGIDADELRDAALDAGDAWGRPGAELEARLAGCNDPIEAAGLLTAALARRLDGAPAVDPAVRGAVAALERDGARVAEVGRELFLSERQLRRRFLRDVGIAPSAFVRVARLQRLLVLAPRTPAGTTLARLAAEAGYSDESHLARDVRDLAGVTPTVLLREHAPLAR